MYYCLNVPPLLSQAPGPPHICVLKGLRALGILGAHLSSVKLTFSLSHGFKSLCWLVWEAGELFKRHLCFVFNEENERVNKGTDSKLEMFKKNLIF